VHGNRLAGKCRVWGRCGRIDRRIRRWSLCGLHAWAAAAGLCRTGAGLRGSAAPAGDMLLDQRPSLLGRLSLDPAARSGLRL